MKKRLFVKKVAIILIWIGMFLLPTYGEELLSGKEIMEKVFNRYDGDDAYFKIEMVLVDKRGNARRRILKVYTKDYGELMKSYLEFLKPPDIRGVKFLSWENKDKDDTQYLYLPALGRARRIVSSQKNLRFVNTDFTYEDMQRRHPDKDTHALLGEEVYQGYPCFVVESIPKKGTSQYSKRISWVDKERFLVLKTEFYNKKGKKCKIFRVEKIEKISGIWTAIRTVMEDLIRQHKTLMNVVEVKYNQGTDDEIFTLSNLEKD
ncbi:MAG: outer membrane lipoprotein-sorting protein [Thermoplasmata archaeon]|nr:MAG: outer membrane lipoprotein-sorting protein [Thermoplasmata archaeon]